MDSANDSSSWDSFQETRKQIDVVKFLNSLGYKRSTKQFSIDVKKGLVKINERGLFTRRQIHQYAKRFLTSGANFDNTPEGYESRKLQEQVKKLERENAEGEFKFSVFKGRYIPRQEMYLQLAGRAAVLDAGFEQFIRSKAGEFIASVSGDQSKSPDFIDQFIDGWKVLLNTYANSQDLEVVFKGGAMLEFEEISDFDEDD